MPVVGYSVRCIIVDNAVVQRALEAPASVVVGRIAHERAVGNDGVGAVAMDTATNPG